MTFTIYSNNMTALNKILGEREKNLTMKKYCSADYLLIVLLSQWAPSLVYFISKAIAVKQGKYRLFGAQFLCCTAASATSLYITNTSIYLRNNESKSYTTKILFILFPFSDVLVLFITTKKVAQIKIWCLDCQFAGKMTLYSL